MFRFRNDLRRDAEIFNRGIVYGDLWVYGTIHGTVIPVPPPGCFADGAAAAPSIVFCSDPDTGIYHGVASGEIAFSSDGDEIGSLVRVDANTHTIVFGQDAGQTVNLFLSNQADPNDGLQLVFDSKHNIFQNEGMPFHSD